MADGKRRPSLLEKNTGLSQKWLEERNRMLIQLVNTYAILDVLTSILGQYDKAHLVFKRRLGGEEKRQGIPFEKGAPILQEAADIAKEAIALVTRFSTLTETISVMVDIKYHPPVKRLKELVEMNKK
jgi:hypothetical protein